MTLSRRSFLRGLAALPLVAAFLPKEAVEEFSTDGEYIYPKTRINERHKYSTNSSELRVEYWDGGRWRPVEYLT